MRQDFSRAKKQQLSPAFLLLVEIWLGAHTPHILRLAGEKADGWLPSQNYIA